MISVYFKELKKYARDELISIFKYSLEKPDIVIKKLKERGVLKVAKEKSRDFDEAFDENSFDEDDDNDFPESFYVFNFVGVIAISGIIIKCYPKYLKDNLEPTKELRLILKVLKKTNSKEPIIRMFNGDSDATTFNLLSVILYLLKDYHDNGTYSSTERIFETNGNGEILWERTINDSFLFLQNNRPLYTELQTRRTKDDDANYFKRLHETVLTLCSKQISETDLPSLFDDIMPVYLNDEIIRDFGEVDYILYRLENELNTQFNTHKQLILKTLYAYILQSKSFFDVDSFSLFGTTNFNSVWEKVCSGLLDNKLHQKLHNIQLPAPLDKKYDSNLELIKLIERPVWRDEECGFPIEGTTFIPDLVTIQGNNFFIFDAKYYNTRIEAGRIKDQPDVESLTKQYLYQLAFKDFIATHRFSNIANCFLMPTDSPNVVLMGESSFKMLHNLGLQPIKLRAIPAHMAFELFLANKKLDISELRL